VVVMILLIIPLGRLSLGGISEKYLPPDNSVRNAQEDFDRTFPDFRTEQLTLVIQNATPAQLAEIKNQAEQITGFTKAEWTERPVAPDVNNPDGPTPGKTDPNVTVFQNGLKDRGDAAKKIDELRNIQAPKGVTVWVGGTPALEQDSIHTLFDKLPLMLVILITTTTLLMFLAFGSLVLPIKAAVMSALTLGSTMGMLTWIFVEGHLSKQLNFTPTPLMAPMMGLIIAVVYGLSTDYEVFLVSRMVEARERGMSTAESIRIGTATTGRLITAAALILVVVAGAFAFSDLVMLKYLAFGLITALILDATIIRMFLVPAIMKLLGDDCWWAPRWMRRIQNRIGLGETHLPDERKRPTVRQREESVVGAGVAALPTRRPADPTHPGAEGATRPGAARPAPRPVRPPQAQAPSAAGTTRIPTGQPNSAEPPTTRMPASQPTSTEPPTTRLSVAAKNAAKAVINNASSLTQRTQRPAQPPPRQEREIESWLGELRGTGGDQATARPSADPTRAMPEARKPDAESTEKLPTQGKGRRRSDEPRPEDEGRHGGGLSAQELLRREGRRL
jgi:trehalose monomycolate/heme transporter